MYNPVVQQRVQTTLAYFGASISITGLVAAASRGTRFAFVNPLIYLVPCLIGMIGCQVVNPNNFALKHSLWGMFTVAEGLSMAGLITMMEMPIIFNALAATAFMVGGLSLYAYMTPTQDFLKMDTALMVGLCSLFGVSLINAFWPSSLLYNLYLYGGLLLFGGFVLYDTQKIIHNASN